MLTKPVSFSTFEEFSDLPEVIYKYRSWEDEFHKSVLTKREVYFAPPDSFEDPLDCKNPVRFDLLTKKNLYDVYYNRLKEDSVLTRKERKVKAKELAKNSPVKDKNRVKQISEETFKEYCERAGILSLTANPLNFRMWEKYSNNHEGFCVGFKTKKMFNYFGGGGPVIYQQNLPVIYPTPFHSFTEQWVRQIFYKEDKWAFEEEYRTHNFKEGTMSLKDRVVKLPLEVFEEVILGAKMNPKQKENLLNCLPVELKQLRIRQSIIVGGSIVLEDMGV